MKRLNLWQQKLIQLLHDPPGKMFFLRNVKGGHEDFRAELFEALTKRPLKFTRREPDRATAGADRPITSPPFRQANVSPIVVNWPNVPILTHPLASGEHGSHAIVLGALPTSIADRSALKTGVLQSLQDLFASHEDTEEDPEELSEEEAERRALEAEAALAKQPFWENEQALESACWTLWRRWAKAGNHGPADERPLSAQLWELQPADSRTPDHSLWDHLRVTSALAFLGGGKQEGAYAPWFLSFSVGPVQRFLKESRTSSDLWTSSMLLSDLVWHAMQVIVEAYGPEHIVYPDLRANPRADQWIIERGWKNVVSEDTNPRSFAGIFPNTFVALVPKGGEGDLLPLAELADKAKKAVQERWRTLSELARDHFINAGAFQSEQEKQAVKRLWDRQNKEVLFAVWSAVAWPRTEKVSTPYEEVWAIRDALPAQSPAPALRPEDAAVRARWFERHQTWIPEAVLARYATARHTYAKTHLGYHQMERGFDYALVHHALYVRQALRKNDAYGAMLSGEPGEKCTLCGLRQVLGQPPESEHLHVDKQRAKVREFWERMDAQREAGAERLCGVCAMKRVLVSAGTSQRGLTPAWGGVRTPIEALLDRDGRLRVPFPSTSTVAAQAFLCEVVLHPATQVAVAEVVRCCEQAGIRRTTFVRALPSLSVAAAKASPAGQAFLEYDAEYTVFADHLASLVRKAKNGLGSDSDLRDVHNKPISAEKLAAVWRAVRALREIAQKAKIPEPGSHVALIALDGDGIRRLLLGDKIGARWRDVIHPKAVRELGDNKTTIDAGWPDLLGKHRLMGPSVHAFVNRALASFAHTIVPWVTEREFHGFVIYAGGDDALLLAPGNEALDIAARLSQIYTSGWIADTAPETVAWSWRDRGRAIDTHQVPAKQRFVVIAPSDNGTPTPWPVPAGRTLAPVYDWHASSAGFSESDVLVDGHCALLPMMGTGQTLSAGIAVGHYKTSLGALVSTAWTEREEAKNFGEATPAQAPDSDSQSSRGNAFSLSRFTRSGEKARLRSRWSEGPFRGGARRSGYLAVKQVIEGFRTGALAGRLPYKLRDVEEVVLGAALSSEDCGREATDTDLKALAKGLFNSQHEGRLNEGDSAEAAFALWWEALIHVLGSAPRSGSAENEAGRSGRAEQGLSVCRFLASIEAGESGEEEGR